jgi:hypothetical protein
MLAGTLAIFANLFPRVTVFFWWPLMFMDCDEAFLILKLSIIQQRLGRSARARLEICLTIVAAKD